jgi:hypothetical protein
METKICSTCKVEKNVCDFSKLKSSKDGLYYRCKKCLSLKNKIYRENNPDWLTNRNKNWADKNPDIIKKMRKNWLDKNPEKRKEYRQNYKPRKQERRKERNENDPIFNITNRMRSRLWKYLKKSNITKNNKTFDIVGCSPQFLKEHLEVQFADGMTWDNRSEWHIDHIIPLSSAKTEDELYKLCHYENLQPLWVEDNLKKSNKIL